MKERSQEVLAVARTAKAEGCPMTATALVSAVTIAHGMDEQAGTDYLNGILNGSTEGVRPPSLFVYCGGNVGQMLHQGRLPACCEIHLL